MLVSATPTPTDKIAFSPEALLTSFTVNAPLLRTYPYSPLSDTLLEPTLNAAFLFSPEP